MNRVVGRVRTRLAGTTRVLAGAVFLVATVAAAPPALPQLTKITDRVYVWSDLHPSGLYATNDLIVLTDSGVLVADGQKDEATTGEMVRAIGRLTTAPIKYVVVCSEHGDHTGGNKAFPSTATFIGYPLAEKDKRFELGGTEIRVMFSGRAHTGTDLQVYLPRERILFASEAFSTRIFPNMRAATPSEWLATMQTLARVGADVVIPGHGSIERPETLRTEFTAFDAALKYAVAEVTRIRRTGATVDVAQKTVNWGPYGKWIAADRNGPVAVQRIYDEAAGTLK